MNCSKYLTNDVAQCDFKYHIQVIYHISFHSFVIKNDNAEAVK